ncbi:IclR family transcriptional regulator [Variovorax sp. RT4R15]|uniref:IclR family transcriptional regulator n=1 Tax=Variovorax sp. RT4R15 TaxID=3443737 RepID=UPI003F44FF88
MDLRTNGEAMESSERRVRTAAGGAAPDGAQAIDRAIVVLLQVSKLHAVGASLSQLVTESGLKQPTVHRLLLALIRGGLVEQDVATKRYHLGYESYVLGELAKDRFGIHQLAQSSVARLAQVSQDTAFLTVRRGHYTVCMHREEGDYPIRAHVLSVGDRHPLGVGAGSIAILAALPDEEVDSILADNAPIYKEKYPAVSADSLKTLVVETRARGFAAHRGLVHPGSWGIGVVVHDQFGQPNAALSIGAIDTRLPEARQEFLVPLMREEAEKLRRKLMARTKPTVADEKKAPTRAAQARRPYR